MEPIHRFLSWFVLFMLFACSVNALSRFRKAENISGMEEMVYGFCYWFTMVEMAVGLIIYISNQSYNGWIHPIYSMNPNLKFFGMTHMLVMAAAGIAMTLGFVRLKKRTDPAQKHAGVALFYTISLLLIVLGSPWVWGYHA